MDLLNLSFGSGGMTCGLDQNLLPYFIQSLKRESASLFKKSAIIRPRKEGNLYFMNRDVTIDEDGNLKDFPESSHVWLKKELISENDKLLVADILPTISLPLCCNLNDLFSAVKVCLKHNFIPGLLVIAGAAMSFYYTEIVKLYGGCSIVVATGPAATGKTTSIKLGLSLFGCSNNNMFVKGTNRGFLERSSLSSLPYGIDDPKSKSRSRNNILDISELAVDLYNGSPTTNYSTGILTPLSIPIIATNFDGDTDQR